MFAWLRQRRISQQQRRLERAHRALLEAARDLQRRGDIQGFAAKTAEAAAAEAELDRFVAAHAAPSAAAPR